jgi:hypothetical protein
MRLLWAKSDKEKYFYNTLVKKMAADTTTKHKIASAISNANHVYHVYVSMWCVEAHSCSEYSFIHAMLGKSLGSYAHKIQADFNSSSNASDSMYNFTTIQSLK